MPPVCNEILLLSQTNDVPVHLVLPLLASIFFVCALMFIKKATSRGVSSWTVTFTANMWAAAFFSLLLVRNEPGLPWDQLLTLGRLWQPAVIAMLYIGGQTFTFLALDRGDVSVATPVLSAKVIIVAIFVTFVAGETPPTAIWYAAIMAMAGIVMVQYNEGQKRERSVLLGFVFALLAAITFAMFDVSVQMLSPGWGPGKILPIAFAMAAVLSVGFLPWVRYPGLSEKNKLLPLLAGTMLIGLQAICIVFALSQFGDAARVNIVYALRALWGVVLAWAFAKMLKSGEMHTSTKVMSVRLIGATLLTVAVIAILV